MKSILPVILGTSLLLACASCVTADLDETDRNARFYDFRVRKELSGPADHVGPHVEFGGRSSAGDVDGLEYSIQDVRLGVGLDGTIAEQGWAGVALGLMGQRSSFEIPAQDLGSDTALGPYVALQGGWRVTPWLEPFARAEAAFLLRDFVSTYSVEAGLRLHPIEHAAAFAGWRAVHYAINDLDEPLGIEQVELDLRGWVLGLELAF